jgi:drug/metabolite transporter (DMT)-like permease
VNQPQSWRAALRRSHLTHGSLLAVFAASLWGISGGCAQYLFQRKGISIDWLVSIRLLVSGLVLLVYATAQGMPVLAIWHNRGSAWQMLAFGVLGMLGVQYTYFAVIEASNAATGTVLQYLGPTVIVVYLALRQRRWPLRWEWLALVLALVGTMLLVTHGDLAVLQISPTALFWGLSSACALAFYTVQPVRLLQQHPATLVVGWGMLTGGLVSMVWRQPWPVPGVWDSGTVWAVLFVVFLGTLVAFQAYLLAVQRIGPQRTSLLACAEPLSAALVAVVWLDVPFGGLDVLGSVCIVATIFVLSRKQ